jgi:hypothetical protein
MIHGHWYSSLQPNGENRMTLTILHPSYLDGNHPALGVLRDPSNVLVQSTYRERS